jgi:DNA-binding MarR family transcriptional regulator
MLGKQSSAVLNEGVTTPLSTAEPATPLLIYMVKQLELATRAQLDALLKESGVTALQYTALSVLQHRPTMSSADLARASFVRAQSTSDLVMTLEKRGLIARKTDANSRRRMLISLTAAGHQFLADYGPRIAELEEKMLAEFDENARQNLRDYLDMCRRALTNTTE